MKGATPKCIVLLVWVVLLTSSTLVVAQSGSLDPSFGTAGIVTTPGTIGGTALAVQSDGKLVVAGAVPVSNVTVTLALARYNTNGGLDSGFGRGGIVTFSEGQAFGMGLQSNGKIVVGAPGPRFSVVVLRFNSNGSLDATFGTSGIVTLGQFGRVFQPVTGSVRIEPNDDILVAVGSPIVRLLPNGQIDAAFGKGGTASVVDGTSALSLLPNGEILAASSFTFTAGAVALYNTNGNLDKTFGVNGQAAGLGTVAAIAPLSNGQFIAAGTLNSSVAAAGSVPQEGFSIVRYNTNGAPDITFGNHSGAITPFPGNAFAGAKALAVQSNGDIIAAGQTSAVNPSLGPNQASFALARYTRNGPLDTTFGTNGLVTTSFGNQVATVAAVAIQSDGKIVVLGNENPSSVGMPNNGFTLARYLP